MEVSTLLKGARRWAPIATIIGTVVAVPIGISRLNGTPPGITQTETASSVTTGPRSNVVVVAPTVSPSAPPPWWSYPPAPPQASPQPSQPYRGPYEVRSSIFEANEGNGFTCRNSPGMLFYNNVASGNRGNGVAAEACPGTEVFNNELRGNGYPSR
jgi:parallel beta-helix repeat protein